jgi:DNA-binding LytR/AlgR family response regulator
LTVIETDEYERDAMKVSVIIDGNCRETCIEIRTPSATDEINLLAEQLLSSAGDIGSLKRVLSVIPGYDGDRVSLLKPSAVMRIYSFNKKVFVQTEKKEYELKMRLYEIEEQLCRLSSFIRISNTDIINFDYVTNLDLHLSGVISVNFQNGTNTFISRRYVHKVMDRLGVGKL